MTDASSSLLKGWTSLIYKVSNLPCDEFWSIVFYSFLGLLLAIFLPYKIHTGLESLRTRKPQPEPDNSSSSGRISKSTTQRSKIVGGDSGVGSSVGTAVVDSGVREDGCGVIVSGKSSISIYSLLASREKMDRVEEEGGGEYEFSK